MLLKLIFSVFLVSSLSADDLTSSTSSVVSIDKLLADITATCLSREDIEQLVGNNFRYGMAFFVSCSIFEESVQALGLQELRKALKLPAPGPWKRLNITDPSEHELKSATIAEYYELKEPHNEHRSLDSLILLEHNVHTAIGFFDKRLPEMRTIFRRTFEEAAPKVVDKKSIDRMIEVFHATYNRIKHPISEIAWSNKCWPVD